MITNLTINSDFSGIWTDVAAIVVDRQRVLDRAMLIGICGPQGSGKSTGASALCSLLCARGRRVAVLSLDDFYLRKVDRLALADAVHPLFATRGPPGTHETDLGLETTRRLLAGESLCLPRFVKQLDDRASPDDWPYFEGPADFVILEGWCVGARPQPDHMLVSPLNQLERDDDPHAVWRSSVNTALAVLQPWFELIDYQILLQAPDFSVVATWRNDQEQALRTTVGEQAGAWMNKSEIERFVQHYERLTLWSMTDIAARADLIIKLAADRSVVSKVYRS